jgi:anti-anti-sigma factor
MPIKCEDYSHTLVIEVDGDFAGENAHLARRRFDERADRGVRPDVVIDLAKSPFIDSQGLESLLWMQRRCEDLFGQFKLVKLDEVCRKILQITRLDHRFECHADLAGALKTMR